MGKGRKCVMSAGAGIRADLYFVALIVVLFVVNEGRMMGRLRLSIKH